MSNEVTIYLEDARKAFKQNDYTNAIEKCKKIFEIDRNNYAALILLAATLKEVEEFKFQTPLILKKAIKIQPDNPLAWQYLTTYYEQNLNNNNDRSKLMFAYCKLLEKDSNAEFLCILNKISELSLQLKDSKILVQSIQSLNELRNTLDSEKLKLVDKTLVQILIDNPNYFNEYQNLLESVFTSVIDNFEIDSRQEYYKKYLEVLYDNGKLTTLIKQAINMHQQFPQDIMPLEYIFRVYYELNILDENHSDIDITQFYESLMKLNLDTDIAGIAPAIHLKETDNLIAAREILKGILVVKPNLLYGWILLSKINVRFYCWEDAENAARQALTFVKHKVEDELSYKLELILIESMSRSCSKQKWETALQMCEKHLRRHHSTQLELVHTRIRVLLDDPDVCIKLKQLESQCETIVQANMLKALYLKQHKQLKEAANSLDSALETSEAWLLLGIIYWEMAEYNYSLMAFLNGIKSDHYNWKCLVHLGHYYREHGNDMERSRRCYQTALQINPNSEEAGIGLSTAYRFLKNQDANIQLLQKWTVKDSGPKWAWLQLGLQYLDQGDALQAIKAFQRVIRADPNNNHNWESLADAYFARGSYTSALKSYQRALELCSNSFYSMIQLANIKLILGEYNNAKEDFKDILVSKPCYVPAVKGLAETCVALAKENIAKQFLGRANDNLQQAMDCLSCVIMERKDISCLWKLLGDVCYRAAVMPEKYSHLKIPSALVKCDETTGITLMNRRDMFLLSTRYYCCALSLSPHSALLWHDLASCYLMQLHLDPLVNYETLASKCLAAGKNAVKLCPSTWLHWNFLGVICTSPYIKNYALAQHAFIMAIDRELNNAMVWSNLGTLYLNIGMLYKANEAYGQAQRADPAYMNSWIGQALIAEKMSRKEAIDLFRHATQLGYHDQAAVGYTHWVLSVLLDSNTKKDSLHTYIIENMHAEFVASDVINWYIERHPNDCYARNAYGLLLERQKLLRSAAEQFAAAISISTNEEKDLVCINLARVSMQLNKSTEAITLCRAVRKINYNSQCHLALSLFKAAQYEESYTAYEAALHLCPNTDIEKAYILCAMAAIAYAFQGVHDAKTLLFQCIQIQPPAVIGYLAAASLGILHGDLNLAILVLNELKPYENHSEYGSHFANLLSYFHLIKNDIKKAIATISKAIFRHPDDVRYWTQLLRILLHIDLVTFNKCAQKAFFLSRNAASMDVVQLAYISSFKYFSQTSVPNGTKSIQKLLFAYPSNIENWITNIATFITRSKEKDSRN